LAQTRLLRHPLRRPSRLVNGPGTRGERRGAVAGVIFTAVVGGCGVVAAESWAGRTAEPEVARVLGRADDEGRRRGTRWRRAPVFAGPPGRGRAVSCTRCEAVLQTRSRGSGVMPGVRPAAAGDRGRDPRDRLAVAACGVPRCCRTRPGGTIHRARGNGAELRLSAAQRQLRPPSRDLFGPVQERGQRPRTPQRSRNTRTPLPTCQTPPTYREKRAIAAGARDSSPRLLPSMRRFFVRS